jgi:hypothetical protein
MAKSKYDGVVVAVRYASEGQVDWVRAYQRRGPTWSDHRMLSRQELIDLLNKGHRIVTGARVKQMASTFETGEPLRLVEENGLSFLVSGSPRAGGSGDHLEGVPRL